MMSIRACVLYFSKRLAPTSSRAASRIIVRTSTSSIGHALSLHHKCGYSTQSDVESPKRLCLLSNVIKDQTASTQHSSSSTTDATSPPQQLYRIACFIRSVRKHARVTFLAVSDGSLIQDVGDSSSPSQTIQAVLTGQLKKQFDGQLTPGAALELVAEVQESKGSGQNVELSIKDIVFVGNSDSASYPLRLESSEVKSQDPTSDSINLIADRMRRFAHLRSRDLRHAAILRCRDKIEGAIGSYFRSQEFVRVVAPILTSSDCEGGGEVFRVESASDWPKEKTKDNSSTAIQRSFWSDSQAFLTVSAQLHLESIALGLGRVYTIGPSFRAEGSATNRHLAEFWMCEGEQMTSVNVDLAMMEVTDVVEGLIRESINSVLSQKELVQQLWTTSSDEKVLQDIMTYANGSKWQRISYTDAIEQLRNANLSSLPPQWGDSLSSEQERWLARKGPIFVTDYPASDKPFYMLLNEDEKTVACFDLLVPRIGELVGGSLREIRSSVLQRRMKEMVETHEQTESFQMSDKLAWYTEDLRKYGCNPHGGFGLGIERLLSWVTNTDSVRDVITFPRVKGPIHF